MSLSPLRIASWTLGMSVLLMASYGISIARLGAADVASETQNHSSDAPGALPAKVEARRQSVQAAITHDPTNEWSAEYYEGDGEGENMLVSVDEKAGVAATWRGCLGLYGANEGSVDTSMQGLLAFHFEMPNGKPDEPRMGTFPEKVYPVRWGERRYLIAEDRGIEFVNAMHHGFEPRNGNWGMFLLATGDEKKAVSGLPNLPASLLALVRNQPLVLTVAHVDVPLQKGRKGFPTCEYRLHFELPPGETLVKGMELRQVDSRGYETAEVMQIDARTAIAEMLEYDACDDVKSPPQRGWSFSTGAYPPTPNR